MRILIGFLVLLLGIAATSCTSDTSDAPETFEIVTTTGMIEDLVRNIAGDRATVTALMCPGVDPHLYKATQGDLARLTGADIVFYNGLHLEGKMAEVLEKLGRQKAVVAIAESIQESELRSSPEFQGNHDPHIWFDVKLWGKASRSIVEQLRKSDPANAVEYDSNAARYLRRLDSLDAWVREQIATIPVERRVLITAHDAFGYFGRAYGVEVKGLQGLSTVAEAGLSDRVALVDLIVTRKIKAVFVESSVPKRTIEAVVEGARSRGHDVVVGGELYSDAMGDAGTPEGTYIGMVSANVNRIVGALR
jgi:manganese/zinc/iron transport system substrate-binding protein